MSKTLIWSSLARVAEVVRGHGGPRRKVWTWTKILSQNIRYFVTTLRFVAVNALFGNLWKKSAFVGQNSASLARSALLHGIYYIFYRVKFANFRLRAKTTHLMRKL